MYQLSLKESYIPAQSDDMVEEKTVGDKLREAVRKYPDTTALVEVLPDGQTDRHWTYSQLHEQSKKLALSLSTRFEKGEHITVWAPNIPEWPMMEYACAMAGLVLVTANPSFQVRELRYVLEQSDSVALFYVETFRGNPMADIAKEAVEGLDAIRLMVDINDYGQLLGTGDRQEGLPEVTPDDPAMIQYTSGTTGFPKGAVLSHRGLINNARFYATRAGFHEKSVTVNMMPMFHTAGCGMITLGTMQNRWHDDAGAGV